MKKLMAIVIGMMLCTSAMATDFSESVNGMFVGTYGSYTNTTGWDFALASITMTGDFGGSNVVCTLTRGSVTNILFSTVSTNSIVYDANNAFRIPNGAVFQFYSPYALTNRYIIDRRP